MNRPDFLPEPVLWMGRPQECSLSRRLALDAKALEQWASRPAKTARHLAQLQERSFRLLASTDRLAGLLPARRLARILELASDWLGRTPRGRAPGAAREPSPPVTVDQALGHPKRRLVPIGQASRASLIGSTTGVALVVLADDGAALGAWWIPGHTTLHAGTNLHPRPLAGSRRHLRLKTAARRRQRERLLLEVLLGNERVATVLMTILPETGSAFSRV